MDIAYLLNGHPWSDKIQYFDRMDSTNAYLQKLASQGAPEGTVILADCQNGGMGRMGRSFHSPAGAGIYMSVLLRPGCRPENLMHLTCAAAVAAYKAIEKVTGIHVQIKWVNDLIFNDKKLAGILTKLSVNPKTGLVDWAIVGIGINCAPAAFPPELEHIVTSLRDIAGKEIDKQALTAELVQQLEQMNRHLDTDRCSTMEIYRKNCAVIGEKVWLIRGDERISAQVMNVDDHGGLIVSLEDGSLRTINSGEISLRKQQHGT